MWRRVPVGSSVIRGSKKFMNPFAELKAILRAWPEMPVPAESYSERPHERLRKALAEIDRVGPVDLAVLIRHMLRYEAGKLRNVQRVQVPCGMDPWPSERAWEKCGCRCRLITRGADASENDSKHVLLEIEADEWEPDWVQVLHLAGNEDDRGESALPFLAAEKETPRHPKLLTELPTEIPCDPALAEKVTGVARYLSVAQAETVRSVVLSPPGSVRLVILPTGSGKSMVGLAASMVGKQQRGLSIVVVPTVALAIDQVKLSRQFFPESSDAIGAWRTGLRDEEKSAILKRIDEGTQRMLFASPESLVGPLKRRLLTTADRGELQAFVIDEAHLVGQWGAVFRPAFQTLSPLWQELRKRCPSVRTVLMTATVTEDTFNDLRHFYDPEDSMETLASVTLRPEPDYFLSECSDDTEKNDRIIETLRHGPRPAILYVTKVEDAKMWYERCVGEGWKRVGLMHGKTTPQDRETVIRKWQNDELDLMIATSAFGLGMDKGDVRLVLHACVPETIDRYYQEVGRGGRDGFACVSMMIWEKEDLKLAKRMGARQLIGDEKGYRRWKAMWSGRVNYEDQCFVDLQKRWATEHWAGDSNLIWNVRTLLLMARVGVIELKHFDPPELKKLPSETDEEHQLRCEELIAEDRVRFAIHVLRPAPNSQDKWNDLMSEYRQQLGETTRRSKKFLDDLVYRKRALTDLLKEVYKVGKAGIPYVSETAEDLPPLPASFPELELDYRLQKWLEEVGVLPMRHQTPVAFITYHSHGAEQRDLANRWIRLLGLLIQSGIREVALPSRWRTAIDWGGGKRNPLERDLTQKALEGFLIVRNLKEDHDWSRHPRVPRVTFLPPEYSDRAIPESLYSVDRSLHLILLPENCRDSADPRRRIGEVRNGVIDLDRLVSLLKI